jgi:hypothetical protein
VKKPKAKKKSQIEKKRTNTVRNGATETKERKERRETASSATDHPWL